MNERHSKAEFSSPMADQLPPHNLSDERGVLACVLQNAQECLPDCQKLRAESFFDLLHAATWRAIQDLAKTNQEIHAVSVSRWLEKHESIEGAFAKVKEIEDSSPSAYNLATYLPSVTDLALRRMLIRGCSVITAQASNGHTTPELLASVEKILSIQTPNASPVFDGKQSGLNLIDDLQRRHELNGALPGIDTGLIDLNAQTDGLQYGEQTLIGARPSIGKTAIGLTIFQHVVFDLKIPSLFVSLEMSDTALMRRMMSSHTKTEMSTIRRGNYTEGNFNSFSAFQLLCSSRPMFILNGVAGVSIGEIGATVRRQVRKNKIKFVVVDYLQKIKPAERHEKRTYEVADVSGKLKALAVETGCAFLTLAQLNRDSEKDKDRLPRLTDLADSSQIERDADTIGLLHRNRAEKTGPATLMIAKQRDGETGMVNLIFNGPLCRFENASKFNDQDIPEGRHQHND